MHGLDAKLDCLVFGERVALLDAAEGFAAEGHPRHRLKQLAVAHLWATLMQALKQLAVELDCLGWRYGHVRNGIAKARGFLKVQGRRVERDTMRERTPERSLRSLSREAGQTGGVSSFRTAKAAIPSSQRER